MPCKAKVFALLAASLKKNSGVSVG